MAIVDIILYLSSQYGPVILLTVAVFLAAETLVLIHARRRRRRAYLNNRLKVIDQLDDRQSALEELRRYSGLTQDGRQALPFAGLNRLVTQSGIGRPLGQLAALAAVSGLLAGTMAYFFLRAIPIVAGAILVFGVLVPLLVLQMMRRGRMRRFENQLPEAVDVMVRSLRAGHPIPVAIALVGREMADPIGSEFGLASDEMTYGLDLETAMVNLRERSGQNDLGFLVIAISIQSKTGGNLAEILSNLSHLMRARFKMRRKIHAITAEGRFSAVGLSIVPLIVFLVLRVVAPTYYADIASHPVVMPIAYLTFGLWLTGVIVMYRMVNFKF